MPNPSINQGTLNRLVGSVLVPDFPELNATAEFMGDEGIGITWSGETTTFIPTLAGVVNSPEPYQQVSVALHLLKTQFLANLYEAQRRANAIVGDIVVRVDNRDFTPFEFLNCAIQNVEPIRVNGKDAGYRVTLMGFQQVNNDLWDA